MKRVLSRSSLGSVFVIAACMGGCGGAGAAGASGDTTPKSAASVTSAPTTLPLQGESGAQPLGEVVGKQPYTVLLFFTAECPVQKAHDLRTRELVDAYGSKGVAFVAVVSEVGADLPATREDVKKRALGLPVFEDKDAALANALGVEYSTHAVLLEKDARILYSGAFDGDRVRLTDSSEKYLKNAIDAALAGKAPPKARTEALGCALRKK